MSIFSEPVVYVDIETSGSNIQKSNIIEVAAIRVENGQVVDEFVSLVNPGHEVPHWITNLTGITNHDLVHAPSFDEIAYQLHNILDGAIFIAHHVRFDYSYIKRQLEEAGYNFRPKLLCTVRLSRALYSVNKGHSLEKIIARHNIPVAKRHRAYDDAAAIKTFSEIAFSEHGSEAFSQAVNKQFKTRSLPPNIDESQFVNVPQSAGVYIFRDEKGAPLYVGKSVNIKDRLRSHFTQDTKLNQEMKLSQNSHSIETIETGSELEALLLESQLVKDLMPTYNKQLRRATSHFVFLKSHDDRGYSTIQIADKNLAQDVDFSDIYGIYASKMKAKNSLTEKQKTFDLCPKLLGLEKTSGACFQYQLGRCKGACIGKESTESYNRRVEVALERTKVESWPFKQPVAISKGGEDYIIVDQWIILGFLRMVEEGEPDYKPIPRNFDVDTYRILRAYVTNSKGLDIRPYSLPG